MKHYKRVRGRTTVRERKPYVDFRADPSAKLIARAARKARVHLVEMSPLQSAKKPSGRILAGLMVSLTICAFAGALGVSGLEPIWLFLCWVFAAIGLVRLCACFVPTPDYPQLSPTETIEAAPIWSILIALYNEADSVASLLAALAKLEWPKDKLDIIFACEHDDKATLAALSALRDCHQFRIITVPEGGPRTKPNALQTALPFAAGRYVTVYDAEDRPAPSQLRAAFHAFVNGDTRLAVVQAPLVTWNHRESWIAGQFALDYAIWFRVMLPAFARLSGFLPLGGTSNHFKTAILREVGGWDPFNVTEDADLGVRLGRNAYLAGLIEPPTYEEAPPKIAAWVRQRGRWIQGHMQTFCVHLRQPLVLAKRLGVRRCIAFFLGLGTGPMAAIVTLPIAICASVAVASGVQIDCWPYLAFGFCSNALAALVACQRDGRLSLATFILTLPTYYCLQTLSACRAIWRVNFTPTIWDKTDHGLAARQPSNKGPRLWTLLRP